MLTKHCLLCKAIFKVYPSLARINYCSSKCFHLSRRGKVTWAKGKRLKYYGQGFEKGHTPWNKNKKGLHLSPTTEFKKGEVPWNKGKKYLQVTGDKNYNWKGENVGIAALHDRVYRHRRKTKICTFCKKYCKTQWANISHEYKRDIYDFMELCPSCHKKYDNKFKKDKAVGLVTSFN